MAASRIAAERPKVKSGAAAQRPPSGIFAFQDLRRQILELRE